MTDAISEGLGRYSIGEKLRSLRLRKSMGLVELGKHTGLSAALLSKLERGKLFPTLPTLLRIAMVFGVGLDYFFTDERKRRVVGVVRREERVRFPEKPGAQDVPYYFECLDYRATERKLSALLPEGPENRPGTRSTCAPWTGNPDTRSSRAHPVRWASPETAPAPPVARPPPPGACVRR